ncbi:MAG: hypothetical protein IT341_10555 [Chloroflexi bacterium]|nr:hypothetical protein [Chloroflexota bacterium]
MLPERTLDDIFARRAVLALGDLEVQLRVLAIEDNEKWTATFQRRMDETLGGLSLEANPLVVVAFLQGMPALQLELLRAYDVDGMLPDDDWIRANATAPQLITGLFVVLAAAFPLAVILLRLALDNADVRTLLQVSLRQSMSGAPANGAGARRTSGVS